MACKYDVGGSTEDNLMVITSQLRTESWLDCEQSHIRETTAQDTVMEGDGGGGWGARKNRAGRRERKWREVGVLRGREAGEKFKANFCHNSNKLGRNNTFKKQVPKFYVTCI